jgi:hypothetical protein
LFPVEESAVRHRSVAANVTNFVPLDGIDRKNAQDQAVIPFKRFKLFSDAIRHEIKHPRLAEILSKGPGIFFAGKVSTAPVPQNHMNRVPLAHYHYLAQPSFLRHSEMDSAEC